MNDESKQEGLGWLCRHPRARCRRFPSSAPRWNSASCGLKGRNKPAQGNALGTTTNPTLLSPLTAPRQGAGFPAPGGERSGEIVPTRRPGTQGVALGWFVAAPSGPATPPSSVIQGPATAARRSRLLAAHFRHFLRTLLCQTIRSGLAASDHAGSSGTNRVPLQATWRRLRPHHRRGKDAGGRDCISSSESRPPQSGKMGVGLDLVERGVVRRPIRGFGGLCQVTCTGRGGLPR